MNNSVISRETLIGEAYEAKKNAYVPYSNFPVGAALLTEDGKIYRGCNIENAAYTPTNCAERTAFFKAVSEGERRFRAIAVAGNTGDYLFPCGVCRQVMMEFCNPQTFLIFCASSPENYKAYTLAQLLPKGFGPTNLNY